MPDNNKSDHSSLGVRHSSATCAMCAQPLLPLISADAPSEASPVFCDTGDDDSDTETRYSPTLAPSHLERRREVSMILPFDQTVTTLLVRNIPRRVHRSRLAEFWPPADSWNILYWPWNNSQRRHCSYAFINFLSNSTACAFYKQWHNRALIPIDSARDSRALKIGQATIQGFWPNLVVIHSKLVQTGEINWCRSQPIIIAPTGECLDIASALSSAVVEAFSV